MGYHALTSNTVGSFNTAIGWQALLINSTSDGNTASGTEALRNNTTGNGNTANGRGALFANTAGGFNTATGSQALFQNRGSLNTANGSEALYSNTTAFFNTAMGVQALYSNTTGLSNTATGYQALFSNITGGSNTANGVQALYRATGGGNIALGFQAGVNLTTGSNNIAIGNAGVAAESGKIRIGKQGTQNGTFIAGIYNMNEGGTIKPVYINSNGRLGTQPPASARKFKEEIKAMEKSSEGILKLKPVTFRYKNDAEHTPQFGLIAEEVANVNPDLVVRDEHGKVYTVRYEAVNAMLLNEFLKEHQKVQGLEATIAQLKSRTGKQEAAGAQQQKQIEALTTGLQKVSAQLELSKAVPQTVLNSQ